ncbi:MAG TPA: hypothetical protein VIL72_00855 [Beijerinckiaceae bacterium]
MAAGAHAVGLSAALLGLAFGACNYVLALVVMARVARRRLAEDDAPAPADVAARLRPIKAALAAVSFVLLPAFGYVAGAMLSSGGEAR